MTNLDDWDVGPDGVRKAAPLTNRGWVLALADRFAPKIARAFLAAVERTRSQTTVDRVVSALQTGSPDRAAAALDLDALLADALRGVSLPPDLPSVATTLRELYSAAGAEAVARGPAEARLRMRFDLLNPRAVDFLRRYDFALVQELTSATTEGLRSIMVRAFDEGIPPRRAAREIRDTVGLTRRMEQAVANYRAELRAAGRDTDQVDRMTARYRRQVLNRRALNIARTETVRAANEGLLEQERQMREAAILGDDARRMWTVTRDDRLCEICAAIPGLNKQGRTLDEPFATPLGNVMTPPAHPSCRCVVRTVSGFSALRGLVRVS